MKKCNIFYWHLFAFYTSADIIQPQPNVGWWVPVRAYTLRSWSYKICKKEAQTSKPCLGLSLKGRWSVWCQISLSCHLSLCLHFPVCFQFFIKVIHRQIQIREPEPVIDIYQFIFTYPQYISRAPMRDALF